MDSPVTLDSLTPLYADQPVVHAGRPATFLRISGGLAIIRYHADSHAVAVPPETLTLRPRNRTSRLGQLAAHDEPTTRERASRD